MHIVYLNPRGRMGGAEAVLLDILKGIGEAEPEWNLNLILSEPGPVADKAQALNVPTTILPLPASLAGLGDSSLHDTNGIRFSRLPLLRQLLFSSRESLAYVSELRSRLREFAPDVIHTNGFKMHILGALAKPKRARLIWHVHDYVQSRPIMASLMKLLSRRCRIALANSESVARDIKEACGNSLEVRTVYNGIDTEEFSPEGDVLDLDSLSGLKPPGNGVIKVGMVSTLARWKGQDVFLRALSLLPKELPWRGYLLGDALYQTGGSQYSLAELNTIAEQVGVSDRVGFTGFVNQPAAAMRALDIVVHASTSPEPFGLVIAEGMACGRPVIVSKAGGAAEVIHSNGHQLTQPGNETEIALSYQPGDASQLAECITKLASDPELRTRLGVAGRASVEKRFNRARMTQELVAIYRSLAPLN